MSDEEWAFVAPYLTLMSEEAPQREHNLREVFNGLRYVVRAGGAWRMMPHDLPPWAAVYQQMQRWLKAGVFEAIVHEERELLRILKGRNEQPSAVILEASHHAIHSPKVVTEQVMTGGNGKKVARSIWRSIPWDIY